MELISAPQIRAEGAFSHSLHHLLPFRPMQRQSPFYGFAA